jgi:DNA modification methylase
MGSGTTAVAAVLERRKFIGFETNKDYFEKANERLRKLTGPFRIYGNIGV